MVEPTEVRLPVQQVNLEALIAQVSILSETVQAQTDRMDQVIKIMSEERARLMQMQDETLTLNEGLAKSLSESDAALDDQAKIMSAMLVIYQFLQAQQAEVEEENQEG